MITRSKLVFTIAAPLTVLGWVLPSVSVANSSLNLNQLLVSSQTSPRFERFNSQVSDVLRSSQTKPEQIECTGTKLTGRRYSKLTDVYVAPFDCRFSNLTLRVNARNFVILPSGRVTPLENAKNFDAMPKPIVFSYQITSWDWKKAPK